MSNSVKKYHPATIVLLVLISWRLWGQFENVMASVGALIMFIAYLVALIGLFLRRRWSLIICGILAILDIPLSLFLVGGSGKIGALVVDLIIIWLAYENYKLLSAQEAAAQDVQADGPSSSSEK